MAAATTQTSTDAIDRKSQDASNALASSRSLLIRLCVKCGVVSKQKSSHRQVWCVCRRLHNLNRRADSLCASRCASPLPRPKAPRCVPLSLRPRAAASAASFASPLRVLCASCLAPLLCALVSRCTNAPLVTALCALSQRLPTPPSAPPQHCTRALVTGAALVRFLRCRLLCAPLSLCASPPPFQHGIFSHPVRCCAFKPLLC